MVSISALMSTGGGLSMPLHFTWWFEFVEVETHLRVIGAVGLVAQALLGIVPAAALPCRPGTSFALVALRAPAQFDAVIGIERHLEQPVHHVVEGHVHRLLVGAQIGDRAGCDCAS